MEQTLSRRMVAPPTSLLKLTFLFLLLLFVFPLITSLAEEPPVTLTVAQQQEQLLLQRLNEIRASYDLPALTIDNRLSTAAQAHANEAANRDWMSHTGANGSSYGQRVARAGYDAASTNEAIGWGNNLDRQVRWWMNSPVHRGIILSRQYTNIGIGYVGDPNRTWGHWWVMNFARPN